VAAVSWWLWVLIWILLVLAALAFLGLLGWRLWKQLRGLTRELGTATDRFSAVLEELERLPDRGSGSVPEAAVFADPVALRAEHLRRRTRPKGSRHRTRT
jgi:hypothetical protein